MNHAVVGAKGEVGTCISQFLSEREQIIEVDNNDYQKDKVNFMHVCIPYSTEFIKIVKDYIRIFNPNHIVIYSTVAPGTTNAIGQNAVHSPIEGRHPNLIKSFKSFTRLVAGKYARQVGQFFVNRGIKVEVFDDAIITELGKLLNSLRYGINLMVSDEEKRICDAFNVDYSEGVLKYQEMYNRGYECIGEKQFQQPLLIPPVGKIGGHCVIPNNEILSKYSFLAKFLCEKYGKLNSGPGTPEVLKKVKQFK